jgi:hypothetical protein
MVQTWVTSTKKHQVPRINIPILATKNFTLHHAMCIPKNAWLNSHFQKWFHLPTNLLNNSQGTNGAKRSSYFLPASCDEKLLASFSPCWEIPEVFIWENHPNIWKDMGNPPFNGGLNGKIIVTLEHVRYMKITRR